MHPNLWKFKSFLSCGHRQRRAREKTALCMTGLEMRDKAGERDRKRSKHTRACLAMYYGLHSPLENVGLPWKRLLNEAAMNLSVTPRFSPAEKKVGITYSENTFDSAPHPKFNNNIIVSLDCSCHKQRWNYRYEKHKIDIWSEKSRHERHLTSGYAKCKWIEGLLRLQCAYNTITNLLRQCLNYDRNARFKHKDLKITTKISSCSELKVYINYIMVSTAPVQCKFGILYPFYCL